MNHRKQGAPAPFLLLLLLVCFRCFSDPQAVQKPVTLNRKPTSQAQSQSIDYKFRAGGRPGNVKELSTDLLH